MITSRKMKVPFVDLTRQYDALREEIDAAVESAVKVGQLLVGVFVWGGSVRRGEE
ncbi:hypothetical protein HKBW3S44_01613 [Candidatus Hakubella thermalkaliphila]|uniref:Uncharacterized protein n=1 Tax=Candidatus Hakubella thermalkaliphila TaxID=2754717 RepID=A0A6V8Q0C5_9ACTN|nr:hypothetical protein [Candidatus Hakubella thermalkaliphila]GFP37933.1 hypothetical protein HKBW3S44_01613 [Candidatus Hakubella thermalkaliphila]